MVFQTVHLVPSFMAGSGKGNEATDSTNKAKEVFVAEISVACCYHQYHHWFTYSRAFLPCLFDAT